MSNNYKVLIDALGVSLGFNGEVYGEFSVSINKNLDISFTVSDSFDFVNNKLSGIMLHPCGDLRILLLNNYDTKVLHFCVLNAKDITDVTMIMLVTEFGEALFKLISKVWVLSKTKEKWIVTDICEFKKGLPGTIK